MPGELTPDAAWCRNVFNALADGGRWGIPRSGLIFARRGETLVLVARVPWEDGMPGTAASLREDQDGDYAATKRHMGEAGIPVSDETTEGGDDR